MPPQATDADITAAYNAYGKVESVFLVEKGGVPKCYGCLARAETAGANQGCLQWRELMSGVFSMLCTHITV